MIKESEIDKLIDPIVKREEEITLFIILLIAMRVGEIETDGAELYSLAQLARTEEDMRKINQMFSSTKLLRRRDIRNAFQRLVVRMYEDASIFYEKQPLLARNKVILQATNDAINQTITDIENLSDSRAVGFMVDDPAHPGKRVFKDLRTVYRQSIDSAVRAVQSGQKDFTQTNQKLLKQLVDSGVRTAVWDSGYTQRIDATVRRNILGGVRKLVDDVQEKLGDQFGADGVELSAHANSAPDHEPVQGRQFRLEEYTKLQNNAPFEDVHGVKFQAIRRPIGEWNCRHIAFRIVIGRTNPVYSAEQLKEMQARNEKGFVSSDGTHYTMYQCTQAQRAMERKIRSLREGQMGATALGDTKLAQQYQTKVDALMQEYQQFSKQCGLPARFRNTQIPNYKRIK